MNLLRQKNWPPCPLLRTIMSILQHTVESQYKRSLVVSAAHTMLLPYLAKSGQSNRLALTLLFRWSTLGLTLNCRICCVITSEMDCLHGFFVDLNLSCASNTCSDASYVVWLQVKLIVYMKILLVSTRRVSQILQHGCTTPAIHVQKG